VLFAVALHTQITYVAALPARTVDEPEKDSTDTQSWGCGGLVDFVGLDDGLGLLVGGLVDGLGSEVLGLGSVELGSAELDVAPGDGPLVLPLADGDPDVALSDGEPDVALADGEPDVALADGEPDVALADGDPDVALADGEPDVALADGDPDVALADGEPDVALVDGEPDVALAEDEPEDAVLLGLAVGLLLERTRNAVVTASARTACFGRDAQAFGAAETAPWASARETPNVLATMKAIPDSAPSVTARHSPGLSCMSLPR
jgi:hypothetical protein